MISTTLSYSSLISFSLSSYLLLFSSTAIFVLIIIRTCLVLLIYYKNLIGSSVKFLTLLKTLNITLFIYSSEFFENLYYH